MEWWCGGWSGFRWACPVRPAHSAVERAGLGLHSDTAIACYPDDAAFTAFTSTHPPSLPNTLQSAMSLVHPGAYQSDVPYTNLGPGAGPSAQVMWDHTPLGNPAPGLIMQQRNGWCDCRLGF